MDNVLRQRSASQVSQSIAVAGRKAFSKLMAAVLITSFLLPLQLAIAKPGGSDVPGGTPTAAGEIVQNAQQSLSSFNSQISKNSAQRPATVSGSTGQGSPVATNQNKQYFKPRVQFSTKANPKGVVANTPNNDPQRPAAIEALIRLAKKMKAAPAISPQTTTAAGGYTGPQSKLLTLLKTKIEDADLQVKFTNNHQIPSFITGLEKPTSQTRKKHQGLAANGDPAQTANDAALNKLNELKALFKMNNPLTELRLKSANKDSEQRSHIRYQQLHNGIPVFGRELIVHTEDNRVYAINGHVEPSETQYGFANEPQVALISEADAIAKALAAMGWQQQSNYEVTQQPALVYFRDTDSDATIKPLILVYELKLQLGLDRHRHFLVDARNGTIVKDYSLIHHEMVAGSGVDYSGRQHNFPVWREPTNNRFYLLDPTRPENLGTEEPVTKGIEKSGDLFILDANNSRNALYYVTNNTADNSSAANSWNPAGVSAYLNTIGVADYFKDTFGRKSFDDNNGNLQVIYHYPNADGTPMNNAFWNGWAMVYGDGDGEIFTNLTNCFDVAVHEMSHGVIGTSANLIYENQSGALNESFADTFAMFRDNDDLTIGENCTAHAPGYLRHYAHPASGLSAQPEHMNDYQNLPNTPQGDHGGVHTNSGIPNRAAYLVMRGLTDEGLGKSIGKIAAEQIYYHALVNYLTPTSVFLDARRALIQSARDYCSANTDICNQEEAVTAIKTAYDTVGIFEPNPEDPSPGDGDIPPADPVAGEDYMAYLYPIEDSLKGDLYLYHFGERFSGFDSAQDFLIDSNVEYRRPTMVTYEGITELLFLTEGGLGSMVFSDIQNLPDNYDFYQGLFNNIAVSPAANKIAFTLSGEMERNKIHLLDVASEAITTIVVPPLSYQEGGETSTELIGVDALSFNFKGSALAFDVLLCLSDIGSYCEDGDGTQFWSLGIINVNSGVTLYPFAEQHPYVDIGYPSYANTNDYVLAFDLIDRRSETPQSFTYMLNMQEGTVNSIIHHGEGFHTSAPGFWGDDSYLVYVGKTGDSVSTYRLPLSNWQPASDSAESLNDFSADLPFMHRAGSRSLAHGLEVFPKSINFGDIIFGSNAESRQITVTNTNSYSLNIQEISLPESAQFVHSGVNQVVGKSQSLTFTIQPLISDAGPTSANLTIKAEDGQTVIVPLSANVVAENNPDRGTGSGDQDNSSSGGGGSAPLFLVVLGAWAMLIKRITQENFLD